MERMGCERDNYACNQDRVFDTAIDVERCLHDAHAASLVLEDMLMWRLEGKATPNGYLELVLSSDEVTALVYGLLNVGDRIRAVQKVWSTNFEALKSARGTDDHG